MIGDIKNKYPELNIIETYDKSFSQYGRKLVLSKKERLQCEGVNEYMKFQTDIPKEGNIYVASDKVLEGMTFRDVAEKVFGYIDIQLGYCNGRNRSLSALEYHKSSEIIVATTRCILLLGKPEDLITEYDHEGEFVKASYHSKKCVALYLEEGEVIELYPRVLHFAPIKVDSNGFKVIIILPKGTNTPIDKYHEDKLLFMTNKWLIAHEERADLIEKGAYQGLKGTNYSIEF